MKIVTVLTFCSTVLSTLCLESNICNPSQCLMWCPEGFKVDSSGCYICECAKPANDVTSDLESATCPDSVCFIDCPHGLAKDTNGCTLCECEDLHSFHIAVNFIHEDAKYVELAAFKRRQRSLVLSGGATQEWSTARVERSDGTTIKVHFRLMGRSSEALTTAIGVMTSRVRLGDDTTVTYADTVFVASSVTSLGDDPNARPGGWWLLKETWQQVALVAVAVAVLVAIVVVIVFLVMKRKRQRQPNEKKKSRSNAAYKKASTTPAPGNKIYLDHVYSA